MELDMGKDTVEDMVEDNKQVVDMDKVDNNYYYNNYYNNSYNYGDTETTTTITTEVQPYSPMLWQVYIEREDE